MHAKKARPVILPVRFPPADAARLRRHADAARLPLSTWVRLAAVGLAAQTEAAEREAEERHRRGRRAAREVAR
jgi:hypothetical protein